MKRISLLVLALLALSASRSFNPGAGGQEFAQWQKDSREFLSQALFNGAPPRAVPLETRFGEKQTRDGYEITRVEFHDRPGHITTGLLAKPLSPKAARLPAVLCLHGHGGSSAACFDPQSMYFFGDVFAQKGYIVFAVDIDHEYLEDVSPFISFQRLPRKAKFPLMGQRVWMVKAAIDFLETDPQVDSSRIAAMGLSNGSVTTMFAAAYDQRIKLAVASGSLVMSDRMWHSNLVHCRCQYIYKLDGALEYYDIFSLIAPRPLLIQNGEGDPIFPIDSARQAFSFIEKAYASAGAPDKAVMDVHNGKHEFRIEAPPAFVEKYMPVGK